MSMKIKSQNGFSLVEVMIAVVIMLIVSLGFTQMISGQQKESRALSEYLASLELQRSLSQIMADGSVCSYMITDSFNTSKLSGVSAVGSTVNPYKFSVPTTATKTNPVKLFDLKDPASQIPTSAPALPSATIPSAAIKIGETASSIASTLKVQSMQIDLLDNGSVSGANTLFLAQLTVNFNQPSTGFNSPVRQIKPIHIPITLVASGAPTAIIAGCSQTSGGGSVSGLSGCTVRSAISSVNCQVGELLTGGICYGGDVCSGNDTSSYGGNITGNGVPSPSGASFCSSTTSCSGAGRFRRCTTTTSCSPMSSPMDPNSPNGISCQHSGCTPAWAYAICCKVSSP
jgi:prepilin-type N-terminal cleavage/methylation domain-containing protein